MCDDLLNTHNVWRSWENQLLDYRHAHLPQNRSQQTPRSSPVRMRFGVYFVRHYSDAIMSAIASQITSLTIVFSIIYSRADQRKHQSSTSLAFVRGIHRWPVNSPHKGPVTRKKCFHLMTSSCKSATKFRPLPLPGCMQSSVILNHVIRRPCRGPCN